MTLDKKGYEVYEELPKPTVDGPYRLTEYTYARPMHFDSKMKELVAEYKRQFPSREGEFSWG